MFKAMDTDNSGAITFDELKAGLRRYGSTLKDTEIRDLMEAVQCHFKRKMHFHAFFLPFFFLKKMLSIHVFTFSLYFILGWFVNCLSV